MLKKLAIVAVTLFVLSVQTGTQTHKAQETAKHASPSPATPAIVPQQGASRSVQGKENNEVSTEVRVVSTPEKDFYDKAPVWINLILALIGVLGIGAALKTLCKLERQTTATERQVQASHDGLRAWLGIEAGENKPISETFTFKEYLQTAARAPQPPRFTWKIKNSGQTPAFITKVGFETVYQDTMMLYTLPIPKMHERFDFIGTGKERENALRIDSFMYRQVITKAKYWRIIFKIEYRDVFDQGRVHETVASFHYYVPAGEGDPIDAGFYQEHDRATNYNT
jgi:hypothetical protein